MRALARLVPLLVCVACGQKVETAAPAPDCNPAVMKCGYQPPGLSTLPTGGNEAGASSGSNDAATLTGQVLEYGDDFFDRGTAFTGMAAVSAAGLAAARVTGNYDGTSFQIDGALKAAVNWFLVVPADTNSGVLSTITPIDTRTITTQMLSVGAARAQDVLGIYQLSLASTELSADRAQIVLHAVDSQGHGVTGVLAAFTTELVAYRVQASWIQNEASGTDDSGLIFLGNVMAGSALSTATIPLSGTVNARVDAMVLAGAVTVITAEVMP